LAEQFDAHRNQIQDGKTRRVTYAKEYFDSNAVAAQHHEKEVDEAPCLDRVFGNGTIFLVKVLERNR